MYKQLFLTALAISAVTAQNIPSCATSCLNTAIAGSGCSATDVLCQCTTGKASITTSVTTCLLKSSCTASDLEALQSETADTCSLAIAAASSSSSSSSAAASSTVSSAATTSAAAAETVAASSTSGSSSSTASTSIAVSTTSSANRGAAFAAAGGAGLAFSFFAMIMM